MPTYSCRCPICGYEKDFIAHVADRDNTPRCDFDDSKMDRFMVPPMITAMGIADHSQVVSPIDGSTLYGRSDYYKHMKKHDVVLQSDMVGEAQHQKKQKDKADQVARKETINRTIQQLGG